MNYEERCECGLFIPLGYGYYNYGFPVKCIKCGKTNQKESEIKKFAEHHKGVENK